MATAAARVGRYWRQHVCAVEDRAAGQHRAKVDMQVNGRTAGGWVCSVGSGQAGMGAGMR